MIGNMLTKTNHQKFFKGDLVVYNSTSWGEMAAIVFDVKFDSGKYRYYVRSIDHPNFSAMVYDEDIVLLTTHIGWWPPSPFQLGSI